MTSPTEGLYHSAMTPQQGDYAPTSDADTGTQEGLTQSVVDLKAGPLLGLLDQMPKLAESEALRVGVLQALPVELSAHTCDEVREAAELTAVRARFGETPDQNSFFRISLLDAALQCDRTQLPDLFQQD